MGGGPRAPARVRRSLADHRRGHRPVLGTLAVPRLRPRDAPAGARVHVDAAGRGDDGGAPALTGAADVAAARRARDARPPRARCAAVRRRAAQGTRAARDLLDGRRGPRGERGAAAPDAGPRDGVPAEQMTPIRVATTFRLSFTRRMRRFRSRPGSRHRRELGDA